MSEKLADVAKAIYVGRNGVGCRPWGRLPKAHKEPYMNDARVAIAAMRSPTYEMIIRGIRGTKWCSATDAYKFWETAIDAALSEPQP